MTMALSAAVSRGCRVVESISRVRNRKASVLIAAWRQDARLPASTQVNTPLHFLLSLQFYFHSSFLLHFQFFFILHLTDFVLLQHHFEEDVSVGPQRF